MNSLFPITDLSHSILYIVFRSTVSLISDVYLTMYFSVKKTIIPINRTKEPVRAGLGWGARSELGLPHTQARNHPHLFRLPCCDNVLVQHLQPHIVRVVRSDGVWVAAGIHAADSAITSL